VLICIIVGLIILGMVVFGVSVAVGTEDARYIATTITAIMAAVLADAKSVVPAETKPYLDKWGFKT
jgi:TM2 domain-containing membrane protein YozV